MKMKSITRSSSVSLKFANLGKIADLTRFVSEYRNVVSEFVNILWQMEKLPKLLPVGITSQISTWISARAVQAAGKQASGIVRGTREKQRRRLYRIELLEKEGAFLKARKLRKKYEETSISKPNIAKINPDLDSRFVEIRFDEPNSFDGWVLLRSLGAKLKLDLPFRRTKHLNEMISKGMMKGFVRLSETGMSFTFEIEKPLLRVAGNTLGIDIGLNKVISCSDGHQTQSDTHGWDLPKIVQRLSRRKKGSGGFRRAQTLRKNFINWSINQLQLSGIKQINIEAIKNIRYKTKFSRVLSHWTYTEIFDKLRSVSEELGVLVHEINQAYTSQRCSCCGWVRKSNRQGSNFKCGKCGYAADSDLNAAKNIALDLSPISEKGRLKKKNRTGFYWVSSAQENIVPETQRT
jgi:IS605 OrfB family transposase